MIFGIFGGHTPDSIKSRLEKIVQQEQRLAEKRTIVKADVKQAMADRETAISEIRTEIVQLSQFLDPNPS